MAGGAPDHASDVHWQLAPIQTHPGSISVGSPITLGERTDLAWNARLFHQAPCILAAPRNNPLAGRANRESRRPPSVLARLEPCSLHQRRPSVAEWIQAVRNELVVESRLPIGGANAAVVASEETVDGFITTRSFVHNNSTTQTTGR